MSRVDQSVMIELNRADIANASLVAKYRLVGAPVPLILVFASNGAMAGGNLAAKLTSEQLVNMVPSPQKAEVLQALQAGQAVFLTDGKVNPLMPAMGPNVAGVIGSAVAAGVFLTLL